jgi:hypothetical protein
VQSEPTTVPRVTGAQQAGETPPAQADGPQADGPQADGPQADGPQADGRRARRRRWEWAEAPIWTDRMLAALETEVMGGVWFKKWPNAPFAAMGLFSLEEAHRKACQSTKVAH